MIKKLHVIFSVWISYNFERICNLVFTNKDQFLSKNLLLNGLRGDGTPSLYEVLPFEINNGNYFLLISFICTIFEINNGNYFY